MADITSRPSMGFYRKDIISDHDNLPKRTNRKYIDVAIPLRDLFLCSIFKQFRDRHLQGLRDLEQRLHGHAKRPGGAFNLRHK